MKHKRSSLARAGAAAAPAYLPENFDQETIKSFDGSNSYLLLFKFTAAPQVGRQYYFTQDSNIDACRLTGMVPHFNVSPGFLETDMFNTYKDEATNFNVLNFVDYKNMYFTLCSKKAGQIIERLPASTFLSSVLPPSHVFPPPPRPAIRKAFDLDISTEKCFLEFSVVPATVLPFVVPVTLYFEKR